MAGHNKMPDYHIAIFVSYGVVSRDHIEVSEYPRVFDGATVVAPLEVGQPNIHDIRQDFHGLLGQVHVAVP
jgi:hypothetical protein